jgi:hypothetical protein
MGVTGQPPVAALFIDTTFIISISTYSLSAERTTPRLPFASHFLAFSWQGAAPG